MHDGHGRICNDCMAALRSNKVPPQSLVRIDIGPAPRDTGGDLPELTFIKALAVASVHVVRHIVVMQHRPHGE